MAFLVSRTMGMSGAFAAAPIARPTAISRAIQPHTTSIRPMSTRRAAPASNRIVFPKAVVPPSIGAHSRDNARIKKIADELERLSLSNLASQLRDIVDSAKEPSNPPATLDRRIRVGEKSFNIEKIIEVTSRHSIMWLNYPYVVEIKYQKRTIIGLVGGEHFKFPLTQDYELHTFKFLDKESAEQCRDDILKQCRHLKPA